MMDSDICNLIELIIILSKAEPNKKIVNNNVIINTKNKITIFFNIKKKSFFNTLRNNKINYSLLFYGRAIKVYSYIDGLKESADDINNFNFTGPGKSNFV